MKQIKWHTTTAQAKGERVPKKRYVFSHSARSGHYHADAYAVRCFDNRFWKSFKRFIKARKLKHIDAASPAGGAKIFASPEKRQDLDYFLREIEKSVLLHKTKRVMLFTHTDCGAYGGIKRFEKDETKEFAFHVGEHKKAILVIKKKFPKLKVESYFIDWSGVVRTS
ncbi:MAG: hypothetical protein UX72_C0004G0012 [Parcubacteria group bacterium GW2011_GWA2_47_10]|nr:MAG: hypothetical protein UX72_C0004G0012 [Parcubacteria group bacterium GW2011_GWA2_47_10]